MAARVCRSLSALALGAAAIVGVAAAGSPAAAAPVIGVAEVVTPNDGTAGAGAALGSGDAATPFSLKLPTGASCSGDSTSGGFRVQSFAVPAGTDPATLTFGPRGPLPSGLGAAFRQPLLAVNTTPFANAATNLAERPGGPGAVINVPTFSFAPFTPDQFPAGGYLIGIACTSGPASATQLDRLWVADIVVGAAGTTSPAAGWKVIAPAPTDEEPPGVATPSASPTEGEASDLDSAGMATGDGAKADANGVPSSVEAAPATAETGRDAFGGPPHVPLPVASLAGHVTLVDAPIPSLLVWLGLSALLARMAMLLARPTATVPVPT